MRRRGEKEEVREEEKEKERRRRACLHISAEDVLRFDIAMDELHLVHIVQCTQNLTACADQQQGMEVKMNSYEKKRYQSMRKERETD